MPARIYVEVTADELKELAKELERLLGVSLECVKLLESTQTKTYTTDGINSAIEGLDSIAKSLGRIIGPFNSRPAQLDSLRIKVKSWQAAKKAAQAVKEQDALKTVQSLGSKTATNPTKSTTKQAQPTQKTGRKKKA